MHYGCNMAVGLMQISMELLILELGMGSQPFLVDCSCHGSWVTASWLCSVWEKAWLFGIHIEEGKLKLEPPRTGDEWLMAMFLHLGFNEAELLRLNKVRIHQQVLYYSNVMDARGTFVDKRYLTRWRQSETWSRSKFPHSNHRTRTFAYGSELFFSYGILVGRLRLAHTYWKATRSGIGDMWKRRTYILHMHDGIIDIYSPSDVP